MPSTDFGSTPLSGTAALAKLATLDADEAHYDGNATLTVEPVSAGGKPEFGPQTSCYYVNGIVTTMADEIGNAATYAGEIHGDVHVIHVATFGIPSDLEKATREKLSEGYAAQQPPEQAVARAVLAHVSGTPGEPAFSGDVHFAAHSRGALVVERGLELAQAELEKTGYSKAQVATMFSKIGVETFGGAASSFPDGVRALHYVNDHDPVALAFGVGPITGGTVGAIAAIGAFNAAAGAFAAGYEVERALTLHPQGPVVLEKGVYEPNPVDELMDAHAVTGYLAKRTPFEQTRAQALGHDAAAGLRASVVQGGVDRLRSAGVADLPDVVRADPWNGATSSGTIVGLSDAFVAQHQGRGAYATFDVARDLGGLAPPEGHAFTIAPDGHETPLASAVVART